MATQGAHLGAQSSGSQRSICKNATGSGAVDGAHGQADGSVLAADFVAASAVDLGPVGNSAVQRFITASVAR